MENFSYISPTQYILEPGAHKGAGALVARHAQKALLVYADEPFMHSSGLYEDVVASLRAAGVDVFELTGVRPNPQVDLVRTGVDLCKKEDIGFVLAVGGGSVVDTAKAVGLGALHTGDVWDFYTGAATPGASLPVGAVMTLPATGSEASNGSVISNAATGEKRDVMGDVLRPVFCLMDPELTYSLPKSQTAYGIADMFSHVTERYFGTSQGVQVTDRLCEGAMLAIIECGKAALENGRDYDARANLMWAAVIAHNGLLGAGRNQDWCTHMMGAPLSGEYNCVHGGTISVLLPVWMEYICPAAPQLFARFAVRVFGVSEDPAGEEATARKGIAALRAFFDGMGLPRTLRELGVPDDSKFEAMAGRACFGGTIGGLRPLNAADIAEIYRRAF